MKGTGGATEEGVGGLRGFEATPDLIRHSLGFFFFFFYLKDSFNQFCWLSLSFFPSHTLFFLGFCFWFSFVFVFEGREGGDSSSSVHICFWTHHKIFRKYFLGSFRMLDNYFGEAS